VIKWYGFANAVVNLVSAGPNWFLYFGKASSGSLQWTLMDLCTLILRSRWSCLVDTACYHLGNGRGKGDIALFSYKDGTALTHMTRLITSEDDIDKSALT
jgi:hypothetical protein